MALRAAKQLYPELEIHFLAREAFADAARRVPWLSGVWTLPSNDLIAADDTTAIKATAEWLRPLVAEPWDFVVNWTFSESSSYLTALIPARIKLGYSRKPDRSISALDGWAQYVQGIVQSGVRQNIHLTDILTTQLLTALQIQVGDPLDEGNSPVSSKGFFALAPDERDLGTAWRDPARKWIGIQLGAGVDRKAWSPRAFAQFVELILSRSPEYHVLLMGGAKDKGREKEFYDALPVHILKSQGHPGGLGSKLLSVVGETSFERWASLVSRCHWIVAADTAVIHLASVLGTRVLNLSLGGVRYGETGPYGNGHYVLAPKTGIESLSAEAAYGVWSYGVSEWAHRRQLPIEHHFRHLGLIDALGPVCVYRSRIRSTTDGGGVVYDPVSRIPITLADWSAKVYGHVARAWYCGWVPTVGGEVERASMTSELIKELRQLDESCTVMSQCLGQARRTADSLKSRSHRLKSSKVMDLSAREELNRLGLKLVEIDGLIARVATTSTMLAGFTQMLRVLMHNLDGNELSEIGKAAG